MAPLHRALSVQKVEKTSLRDNESCWSGTIDLEWTVALVPNGGYVIGLVIEACIAHQKFFSPNVVNPVHVSTHFLHPVQGVLPKKEQEAKSGKQPARFDVYVKSIKGGSSLNNIQADLMQKGQTMVTAHLIFGTSLSDASASQSLEADNPLVPPNVFARRIPLRMHPSHCPDIRLHPSWNFQKRISGKEDPTFQRSNRAENRNLATNSDGTGSDSREPPGLEFGSWLTLQDEIGTLRPSMLPFCVDIIKPLPELLPPSVNPLIGKTWYPTLTMTIEFKAPIRLEAHSADTFGLYSLGRYFQNPLGRHETMIEVWTAPSGEAKDHCWRDEQRCLAIATQTALCIPFDAQLKGVRAKA